MSTGIAPTGLRSRTTTNLRNVDDTRWLHPVAWWSWALGLAVAASTTTNPLLLIGLIVSAAVVVDRRKPDAPWARSFGFFIRLAIIIVIFRLLAQIIFVAPTGTTLLIDLPGITLPSWLAGIRLGGALMLEPALTALYDGLRLAAIIISIGAASSLASPSRLLKSVPAAVYEIGVSVVVATTFLPQLASDVSRIRANRRLRGRRDTGLRGVSGTVMPVLHGAMDRSISLAAAMDSRGYGRVGHITSAQRRLTTALLVIGLVAATIGTYGLLGTGSATWWGPSLVIIGLGCALGSLALSGRRNVRTRYRPNAWRAADIGTVASGAFVAVLFLVASALDPAGMNTGTSPPVWPSMPVVAIIGLFVAVVPAFLTPPPPINRVNTDNEVHA